MSGGQKTLLTYLAIAAGGLALYFIVKKQVSGATAAIGNTIASPFEALYTSITGLSPTPTVPVNQTPTTATCYYRDSAGNLMYDSSGNILSGPCAPGDIGTTPYPGG